ncbi:MULTISPECIES: YpmA family protein [Gracilibacillus]|uniref:YpmA family protein n=1 Tax=Gracilibacillus TaxID=74385 RepID=UPI001F3BB0BC|nr:MULTISPECIES: YpmA family protein [Gracilibacillus]
MNRSTKTTLSTVEVHYSDDLYKLVDSLNRTLKQDNLTFGLTLSEENHEKAIFSIYRIQ